MDIFKQYKQKHKGNTENYQSLNHNSTRNNVFKLDKVSPKKDWKDLVQK